MHLAFDKSSTSQLRCKTGSSLFLPMPTALAGVGFLPPFVCLFVCFLHDISNIDAARITKLDVEMSHYESRKVIYFGVKSHRLIRSLATKTLSA